MLRYLLAAISAFALVGVCLEAWRRKVERENAPTLVAEWRALIATPIVIKGRLRQPRLRKAPCDRPKKRKLRSVSRLPEERRRAS